MAEMAVKSSKMFTRFSLLLSILPSSQQLLLVMWDSWLWTSSCPRSTWGEWATCTLTVSSPWLETTRTPPAKRTLRSCTLLQKVFDWSVLVWSSWPRRVLIIWLLLMSWMGKRYQLTRKSSPQLICQPFPINSVHRSRTEAGSSSNQSANNSGKTKPVLCFYSTIQHALTF